MDGRYMEMMGTAKALVEFCMQVKKGEQVLVLTDWNYQDCFGGAALQEALIAELNATEAEVLVMFMKAREGHEELPAIISQAMKIADVVVTIPTEGVTHTKALKDAMDAGTRILMMPCAGEVKHHDEIILKMMPKTKAELEELAAMSLKVEEIIKNAKEIHLVTELGTDLTMNVGKTLGNWGACTGILVPGRAQHIPTGQLAFGVDQGSANGVFVVDGSISPMCRPLNEPVTFTVKDGFITEITGGADADYYRELMASQKNREVYNIAEIGFGTNPKGKITGHPLGDERLYGSAHIGIGSNAVFGGDVVAGWWHEDATFSKVTAYADGKMFMDKGEFLL